MATTHRLITAAGSRVEIRAGVSHAVTGVSTKGFDVYVARNLSAQAALRTVRSAQVAGFTHVAAFVEKF